MGSRHGRRPRIAEAEEYTYYVYVAYAENQNRSQSCGNDSFVYVRPKRSTEPAVFFPTSNRSPSSTSGCSTLTTPR